MCERQRRIYLAGDSTVQSYTKVMEPQTGWGQVFYEYFKGHDECVERQSIDSRFTQSRQYELPGVVIDNRAMAGRSSRNYRVEGRLLDIADSIKEGDYLFVQFGHNDANKAKEERYVEPEKFGESLMPYVEVCRKAKATCVLITAIAMRNCDDNPEGKFTYSFPEYREAMIAFARKENIPLLDLGKATTELCEKTGPEGCKQLFLWVEPGEYPNSKHKDGKQDNAHLKVAGARAFAGVLRGLIKAYNQDDRLDFIKAQLR
jgi:carbohydrate esterase family 12 est12B